MLDRAVLLKPALKYAIADVDSLDQFWLPSDGRLENLKSKIFFHNFLKLFIIKKFDRHLLLFNVSIQEQFVIKGKFIIVQVK